MKIPTLLAVLLATVLTGCATRPESLRHDADLNTRVVIRRESPFGGHPAFSLEINGRGKVVLRKEWLGNRRDATLEGTIAWNDLLQIIDQFEQIHFFSIDSVISYCSSVTDSGSSRVTLVVGRQSRTIEYDWSCSLSTADDLRKLEASIFERLHIAEWDPEVGQWISP